MNQNEAGAVLRPLPAPVAAGGALRQNEGSRPTASGTPPPFSPQSTSVSRGTAAPPARTSGTGRSSSSSLGGGSLAESARVPAPGTRIHQYELIRQLGSGGMGTVFLARDTRLGRRVAIKFLHSTNPEVTQRFLVEARATARCSHENIVIIYEVGEYEGSPFMVLEYLQGQPLNKAVSGQRLPATRAAELMVPVVRALATAHAHGIVHRDLKPENILVTEAGSLKVLDFGIAKVLQAPERAESTNVVPLPAPSGAGALPASEGDGETQSHLTRGGAILGTLSYMSPEQWRGSEEVDCRTDIWAVGIMLFRMLAGKHPLDPLRGPQLAVTAFMDEPMPRLRDVAPDVPPALAEVVDRCLLKHKAQRWPDALALLRALEPFLPGRYTSEVRLDESPYAGLSSFQESDANRFFGRSKEIAALVGRLKDRPLLAVVGPSGAGKSSFVRAGLVPVLKRSGEAWEAHVVRPGRQPLAALAHLLTPLVTSSTSLAEDLKEHNRLIERMRKEPGIVGSVLRSRARREKRRILLFVDQFEELYTQVADAQERRAFTACLSGIADDATSPMRVVLSLRSDFLDRVPEDERFMAELNQGLFFLTTPGREGLRDALVQPAERAGYRFESPELVESMLQHLAATQGALPLLQFAATQLWEQRDPTRKQLTQRSYLDMGGIAGALATHADSVLNGLPSQGQQLARTVLLRLVTPERTRAIVSLEELRELSRDKGELQQVTDQLVQARLLVVQTGGGAVGGTVELVHESLISGWPTLKRWLDEGQEDSVFLEQLRTAARQWQSNDQDSDLLWRGELVEEARRFQRRYVGELPKAQQAFLEATFAQETQATRRKRALVVGAMVFLSLLLAAAAVALVVLQKATKEAREAAEVKGRAEQEARQHLEKAQAEKRERQEAYRKVEQTSQELATINARLQRINADLEEALAQAEHAKQRAKAAQKRANKNALAAKRNALAAKRAEQEALRAAKELQLARDKDQKRIEELEKELGSIIPTLFMGQ
ncbi:serine/threonine-protein kinase [Hyalangium rubrum]|uniref:mitogen-activated protein kinase kinase n=1 Tax=Hyalangium rubrum TaxID=3103134 RepID=A0ABU5H5C8_9BACT|nr:protein kinase [Hyalangium sp. s54d21]MDY7227290.1 protein kinase [Hyalangium sp. s54d21]